MPDRLAEMTSIAVGQEQDLKLFFNVHYNTSFYLFKKLPSSAIKRTHFANDAGVTQRHPPDGHQEGVHAVPRQVGECLAFAGLSSTVPSTPQTSRSVSCKRACVTSSLSSGSVTNRQYAGKDADHTRASASSKTASEPQTLNSLGRFEARAFSLTLLKLDTLQEKRCPCCCALIVIAANNFAGLSVPWK